jgi:iron(III) transport system ATP-binding protein
MLVVEGISHAYGGRSVLDNASLRVAPGEILCLLGPSGCGKTTLLRLLAGLEPLQQGRILLDGVDLAATPPERRGAGLVFQDFALFPHLSALDNVAFGIGGDRARAHEALRRLGMEEAACAFPHTLSGGQQQRVALARALAPRPRMMLLDEPFSGLDTGLRARLREDTRLLLQTSGAATVLVTHDPEEAMFVGDRIAVMDRGRIVQNGTPETLYFRPASAFVASFFGELNRIEARVERGQARTALGEFEANGFAEGCLVEVLIRPEAFLLTAAEDGPARVLATRLLGRMAIIDLELGGEGPLRLQACVAGDFLPPPQSRVAVGLDRRRAHVFAMNPPGIDKRRLRP